MHPRTSSIYPPTQNTSQHATTLTEPILAHYDRAVAANSRCHRVRWDDASRGDRSEPPLAVDPDATSAADRDCNPHCPREWWSLRWSLRLTCILGVGGHSCHHLSQSPRFSSGLHGLHGEGTEAVRGKGGGGQQALLDPGIIAGAE